MVKKLLNYRLQESILGLLSKIMIFGAKVVITGMNIAYLLIGGNLGDRAQNLATAIAKIIPAANGRLMDKSAVYETAAWGNTDQPAFLNQALKIKTTYTPTVLLKKLLAVEKAMGRERKQKNDPRVIDIDIIFFNELVMFSEKLTLPHPFMQDRRFVLTPLQEIAPQMVHPILGKSVTELLRICTDTLEVKKYS